METEEVQEQLTPMITDDLDSDVSMATAQSGSAVPTDEDMSAPSPAANVAEAKETESSKLDTTFTEIKDDKTTDASDDSDIATSKTSKLKDPICESYVSNPMTVEDLRVLSDCFFLPYEHGSLGKRMVKKFTWLRENAIKLSRASDKKSEEYMEKVKICSMSFLHDRAL